MDQLPVKHFEISLRREEAGFLFPGAVTRHSTLLYAVSQDILCVWQGCLTRIRQGSALLLPPDSWYMLFADPGSAPTLLEVQLEAADCPDFACLGLEEIAGQILWEHQHPDGISQAMILLLCNRMLLQLRREGPACSLSPNAEQRILCRALQLICQSAYTRLSVPELAKKAQISPSYLTALFHKHLPFSPAEWIRRVKLQESKRMICQGQLNLTQIAARLEYSTVHQFSRQFKECFGITPSEYARQNKAL